MAGNLEVIDLTGLNTSDEETDDEGNPAQDVVAQSSTGVRKKYRLYP